jgi:PST family polysaccharide transporter
MSFSLQRLKGSQIFESEHLSHDLGGKALRGGGITLASQGVLFGINLIRAIILARLLTPEDFGLIGMVTVFVNFAVMFKDAGLSMATVQRARITEEQISSLFWCNIALSLGLGLVICAAAPLVSLFYGKPELTRITIALSGSFIFSGFQIQHLALLRRHMLYGQIAAVNIISNTIALVVAVFLALKGGRYWALVGSSWAQATSALFLTGFFCVWVPKKFQRGVGLRSMLTFGGHLTGFNLLNFFSRNLDYILIGRFLGAGPLGVYQRAYTLMMQPLQNLNGPLSAVGIPTLSRLQDDPARYRHYFLRAGGVLLLLTMPLAAFFMVMSKEIILVLFGDKWSLAIKPFMFLSICVVVQPLGNIAGWLFISQGRSKDMMIWGVVSSSVTMASIALGLLWGINGVAACYALVGLFFMPVMFWFVGRKSVVTTADLYSVFWKKIGYFAGVFSLLYLVRRELSDAGATDLWSLLIAGGIFGVCMAIICVFSGDAAIVRNVLARTFNKLNRE